MMIFGGIVGFVLGGFICTVVAALIGLTLSIPGPIATALAPLVSFIVPLLAAISPLSSLILGIVSVFVTTGIAYALGAVSLLGPMAATPISPIAPTPLPGAPLELFARGFIIGLTASINFGVWAVISHSPLIGSLFAVVGLLALIPAVSRSFGYQAVLGWTSWLLPMSYLVTLLGILLFIVNLIVTLLATGALPGIRLDLTTGTIETAGGTVVVSLFGITGGAFCGFNLGNFTFINFPACATTPFLAPPVAPGTGGVSTHETGHTLTIAAFGGFFGWINAYDETLPPLRRLTLAYGEVMPESHFPRIGFFNVTEWSAL